jgi:Uma2 family endonuclease
MAAIPFQQEIHYPESDGRPMGETPIHIQEIMDLLAALHRRYRDTADVYVGGDMLLYYVEGNPARCVCPDVFVTLGIPKEPERRSYFLWREGRPPSMVIEVTSEGSRREDQEKKQLYARLGVEEYFLDDPLAEYLNPPLQGYRLVAGRYEPIEPESDGSLLSRTTGLRLRRERRGARLIDAESGEPLLRIEEAYRALDEKDRALRAVEEELARLRRERAE